jgi:hypothetical protein
MLGEEDGCFNDAPMETLWNIVPGISDYEVEAIAEELASSVHGALTKGKGWNDFIENLGQSEHTAYDRPMQRIVNAIIQVAHNRNGEPREAIKSDTRDTAEDDPHVRATSMECEGPRFALKCNGDITHVSESLDSSNPDADLSLTYERCKSLTIVVMRDKKRIDRIHTENVCLCGQFKLSQNVSATPLVRSPGYCRLLSSKSTSAMYGHVH